MTNSLTQLSNNKMKRALSLDALRGFAILMMVLSGAIPFGVLPAWMYHAQAPPPSHQFNPNLPGITWVDLVFPFFLFALGTAIPLALGRRIAKGDSSKNIIWHVIERTLLLGFFAIFLRHVRPYIINPDIWTNPRISDQFLGLLGFILMFAIFIRSPKHWSKQLSLGIKIGGWVGAVLMLIFLRYPDGNGFSLYRNNIILVVLTNAFFFGSIIWLATRKNILLRLAILGIYLGLRLSHDSGGWIGWIWTWSPFPWIYRLDYLKYLFIVIPGTIIGDLFIDWKRRLSDTTKFAWSSKRLFWIIIVMLSIILIELVGLQARWLWQTTLLSFLLLIAGGWLAQKPGNELEKLIKTFFAWGAIWLILGLVFEPFEGGIKKDHSTISYYFLTSGLSIFLLIAFMIIIDIFKKQKLLQLLIDNGQNPMIAYVGLGNLIRPVFGLLMIDRLINVITPTPWLGFLRGVFYTLFLAFIVRLFTRGKLFWRT